MAHYQIVVPAHSVMLLRALQLSPFILVSITILSGYLINEAVWHRIWLCHLLLIICGGRDSSIIEVMWRYQFPIDLNHLILWLNLFLPVGLPLIVDGSQIIELTHVDLLAVGKCISRWLFLIQSHDAILIVGIWCSWRTWLSHVHKVHAVWACKNLRVLLLGLQLCCLGRVLDSNLWPRLPSTIYHKRLIREVNAFIEGIGILALFHVGKPAVLNGVASSACIIHGRCKSLSALPSCVGCWCCSGVSWNRSIRYNEVCLLDRGYHWTTSSGTIGCTYTCVTISCRLRDALAIHLHRILVGLLHILKAGSNCVSASR